MKEASGSRKPAPIGLSVCAVGTDGVPLCHCRASWPVFLCSPVHLQLVTSCSDRDRHEVIPVCPSTAFRVACMLRVLTQRDMSSKGGRNAVGCSSQSIIQCEMLLITTVMDMKSGNWHWVD